VGMEALASDKGETSTSCLPSFHCCPASFATDQTCKKPSFLMYFDRKQASSWQATFALNADTATPFETFVGSDHKAFLRQQKQQGGRLTV